jgi:hypothetical protein
VGKGIDPLVIQVGRIGGFTSNHPIMNRSDKLSSEQKFFLLESSNVFSIMVGYRWGIVFFFYDVPYLLLPVLESTAVNII